ARRSPERFAVRRALLRLLAPRHPPVAHSSLTSLPAGFQPEEAPMLAVTCSSSKALLYFHFALWLSKGRVSGLGCRGSAPAQPVLLYPQPSTNNPQPARCAVCPASGFRVRERVPDN